jgi:hypothetical protein
VTTPDREADQQATAAAEVTRLALLDQQAAAAQQAADKLVGMALSLVRNGMDLRHPERLEQFADHDVRELVAASSVDRGCHCALGNGQAALAVIGELSRRLAEAAR